MPMALFNILSSRFKTYPSRGRLKTPKKFLYTDSLQSVFTVIEEPA